MSRHRGVPSGLVKFNSGRTIKKIDFHTFRNKYIENLEEKKNARKQILEMIKLCKFCKKKEVLG